MAYSPASMDLGLGDQLKSQLEAEEEQRKKKLLNQARLLGGPMTPAVSALYPGLGSGGAG